MNTCRAINHILLGCFFLMTVSLNGDPLSVSATIAGNAAQDAVISFEGEKIWLSFSYGGRVNKLEISDATIKAKLMPYLTLDHAHQLYSITYPVAGGPVVVSRFDNGVAVAMNSEGEVTEVRVRNKIANGFHYGVADQIKYRIEAPKDGLVEISSVSPVTSPAQWLPVPLWVKGERAGVAWLKPNGEASFELEYRPEPGQPPVKLPVGAENFGNLVDSFRTGETNIQFHVEGNLSDPARIMIQYGAGDLATVYPSADVIRSKEALIGALFSEDNATRAKAAAELGKLSLGLADYIDVLQRWVNLDKQVSPDVARTLVSFLTPYLVKIDRGDMGWGPLLHRLKGLMRRDPIRAARLMARVSGIEETHEQMAAIHANEVMFKPPEGPLQAMRLQLMGGKIRDKDSRLQKVARGMGMSVEQLTAMAGTFPTTEQDLTNLLIYGAQFHSVDPPDANPAVAKPIDQKARVAAAYLLSLFPSYAHTETQTALADPDLLTTLVLAAQSADPDESSMASAALESLSPEPRVLARAGKVAQKILSSRNAVVKETGNRGCPFARLLRALGWGSRTPPPLTRLLEYASKER